MKLLRIFVFFMVVFAMITASCKKDRKAEQISTIEKLEKELYQAQSLDRTKGQNLIDAYIEFSEQYPNDTLSAHYLFNSGEIAMNLQLGTKAIFCYDKLLSDYPDYNKVPEVIFLKAFVYENQLGDLTNAEKFYREFISKYPNHSLADDAQASLEYLGKSPEELVKIFQEKNEKKE